MAKGAGTVVGPAKADITGDMNPVRHAALEATDATTVLADARRSGRAHD